MRKKRPSSAADVRVVLAQSLLGQVARLLFEFGLSRQDVIDILTRVPERTSGRPRGKNGRNQIEMGWWSYARILSLWHHDHQFVDITGRPAPLRLKGKMQSFESLVRQALPGAQPSAMLKKLTELGALRRTTSGAVLPANRHLVAHKRNYTTLLRALETIQALSSTMHRNIFARGSKAHTRSLFERSAVSEKFDMRHLRRLNSIVKTQGQSMLELVDEWMSRHEAGGRRRTRAGYVGVGIYLYAGGPRKMQTDPS
jgi:hypothetical protein